MKRPDRRNRLREIKSRQDDPKNANREFEKRLIDIEPGLWGFLSNSKEIIFSIKNWDIYRRAAEAVKEIPHVESSTPKPTTPSWVPRAVYTKSDQSKLKLLKEGRVADFNLLQSQTGSKPLILPGVDLQGVKLSGINLNGAQLRQANLDGAILDKADLGYANLEDAKIRSSSLVEANLVNTNLSQADFTNSNLTHANLIGAYLWGSILKGATLYDVRLGEIDPLDFGQIDISDIKVREDQKRELEQLIADAERWFSGKPEEDERNESE
jgi:hypothetical protein